MEELKLLFQFKHKMLPTDILNLFKLNSVVSSQCMRNVFDEGLFVSRIYTTYSNKSLRYSAPLLWNNFLKGNSEINTINKLDTLKIQRFKIQDSNDLFSKENLQYYTPYKNNEKQSTIIITTIIRYYP